MSQDKINHICLLILASVAVVVSLIYTQKVLVPFVISFFIFTTFSPLIYFLKEKTKMPKLVILGLVASSVFFIIGLVSVFAITSVNSFIIDIAKYQEKVLVSLNEANSFLGNYGLNLDISTIEKMIREYPVSNLLKNSYGNLFAVIGNVTLITIITMFLFTGAGSEKKSEFLSQVHIKIAKYSNIKLASSLITAICVGVILFSFDVELAFLFVVLTFILNFIPSIGSIIAVILPTPIIFLQNGFSLSFFIIIGLLISVQFVIGSVLEPKIMGKNLNLHPITILLFLIFWGMVWGIPGMFLAVPITSVLKIILMKIPSTKKVAKLFEGEI